MKKISIAAWTVAALTLASLSSFASDDRKEAEKECHLVAMDEDLTRKEVADQIDECVAKKLAAKEGEAAADKEEAAKPMKSE